MSLHDVAAASSDSEEPEIPTHVPPELVVHLDHHSDAAAIADPLGYMDPLRERYRVFYSPAHEGFWVITRFADMREALQRPDLFSSDPVGIPGAPGYGGLKLLPIGVDPPEHTRYRSLINPAFSPRRIRDMEAMIRQTAVGFIDRVVDRGECDFIAEYARPLPTTIFAGLLGLPTEKSDLFGSWIDTLLHTSNKGEDVVARRRVGGEIGDYLRQLIAERRRRPADDLISDLIGAEVDGERLSPQEVLRICFLLFMAGLDTVTAAHGFFFRFLAGHPGHRARIIEDPGVIPSAVEELLRVHSFVSDARTVVEDMTFAGVEMRAGDRVLLPTCSAGRDPRAFPDPLTVNFDRRPNSHLAFAAGPHRCVGAHLARLELYVTLEEWHRQIPDYTLAPDAPVVAHCGNTAGLENLSLTWNVQGTDR